MSAAPESPLAQRRLLLRAQLRAQREAIARQLAAGRHHYPRSATMRLLLQRPALVIGILSALAGTRAGRRLQALTIVLRLLTAFAALGPRGGSTAISPVQEE